MELGKNTLQLCERATSRTFSRPFEVKNHRQLRIVSDRSSSGLAVTANSVKQKLGVAADGSILRLPPQGDYAVGKQIGSHDPRRLSPSCLPGLPETERAAETPAQIAGRFGRFPNSVDVDPERLRVSLRIPAGAVPDASFSFLRVPLVELDRLALTTLLDGPVAHPDGQVPHVPDVGSGRQQQRRGHRHCQKPLRCSRRTLDVGQLDSGFSLPRWRPAAPRRPLRCRGSRSTCPPRAWHRPGGWWR